MKRPIPPSERGAALLTVLLLVAVMGTLSAVALERMKLSIALASNSAALDQARAYAQGMEALATIAIEDMIAAAPERTTLAGGWNGAERVIPLPDGGTARLAVSDGGNCFNINSLGQGEHPARLSARPAGITQFTNLLRLLDVPTAQATRIAAAAADWIDADQTPLPNGAEDGDYTAGEHRYRPANSLFAEVSELRAIAGVTPEIYDRVRPWLCALPVAELSPINVNTLAPGQAALLSMLAPDLIPLNAAQRLLAERRPQGWGSLIDFWREPALAGAVLPLDVQLQPQIKTRWFALQVTVERDGAELVQRSLADARRAPVRIVSRSWDAGE